MLAQLVEDSLRGVSGGRCRPGSGGGDPFTWNKINLLIIIC